MPRRQPISDTERARYFSRVKTVFEYMQTQSVSNAKEKASDYQVSWIDVLALEYLFHERTHALGENAPQLNSGAMKISDLARMHGFKTKARRKGRGIQQGWDPGGK